MDYCGKASKAKEEHKIAGYKEEINLIIAEEVAERKTEAKPEPMIESLDKKIQKKEWKKETIQYNEKGETDQDKSKNRYLIVQTKEGYEFTIDVDNEKETAKIVTESRTPGETYTITYDSNGGEGTSKKVEVRKGLSTILEGDKTFSREYFTFAGWYERPELEEGAIAYLAGSSYKPEKDVTLYAIWANNAATISFNANGGTGEMASVKITRGGTATLPVNGFERAGYQFVKWNTKADGKGIDYAKLGSITATEDITLYAIWEVAPAKVGEKVIVAKKDNYMDKDGETATVPAGFAIVPGCSDISEGLVISDLANDTENGGNQFVWVPVPNIDDFKTVPGYNNLALQTKPQGGESSYVATYKEPYEESGYQKEVEEYNKMKASVTNYQGFYIARYEAGKDDSGNAVAKKGASPYVYVPWGNTMTDVEGVTNTEGKVGAVKLARDFATSKKYKDVTSTLCYGLQWDAALKFIDPSYMGFAKDSTNQGWYSDNYNATSTGNMRNQSRSKNRNRFNL